LEKFPCFQIWHFIGDARSPHEKKAYGLIKQSMTVIATLLTHNFKEKGPHVSWSGIGFIWSLSILSLYYLSFMSLMTERKSRNIYKE